MANMAMAQAVLEHADQFYDVGGWYVVAECWDAWAVLEELDQHEDRTAIPFTLEAAAIAHFAALIAQTRSSRRASSANRAQRLRASGSISRFERGEGANRLTTFSKRRNPAGARGGSVTGDARRRG
jgi:hypothetical protein